MSWHAPRLSAATGLGQPEKWLIYPSLIVVYVSVTAFILLLPLAAAIATEAVLKDRGGPESSILSWARSTQSGEITAFSLLTFGCAWGGFLSFVAWWRPAVVRDGYAPFARASAAGNSLLGISVLCLLIFLACAAVWVNMAQRSRDRGSGANACPLSDFSRLGEGEATGNAALAEPQAPDVGKCGLSGSARLGCRRSPVRTRPIVSGPYPSRSCTCISSPPPNPCRTAFGNAVHVAHAPAASIASSGA